MAIHSITLVGEPSDLRLLGKLANNHANELAGDALRIGKRRPENERSVRVLEETAVTLGSFAKGIEDQLGNAPAVPDAQDALGVVWDMTDFQKITGDDWKALLARVEKLEKAVEWRGRAFRDSRNDNSLIIAERNEALPFG